MLFLFRSLSTWLSLTCHCDSKVKGECWLLTLDFALKHHHPAEIAPPFPFSRSPPVIKQKAAAPASCYIREVHFHAWYEFTLRFKFTLTDIKSSCLGTMTQFFSLNFGLQNRETSLAYIPGSRGINTQTLAMAVLPLVKYQEGHPQLAGQLPSPVLQSTAFLP